MTFRQHIRRAWLQHPLADGVICGVAFVAVTLFLIHFVLPAWAASFPVGGYVIDIGEWAPWVGIGVTCVIWWDARQAKRKAGEAAATATAAVADIKAVSVQIDGLLVDRDKAKIKEGEAKEKQVGEDTAATLAKGQEQGRISERDRHGGLPGDAEAARAAATAAAAIAAPPAAAIAAPPAAAVAAPPVVKEVVPPAVEQAVKDAFDKERRK